MCKLVETIVDIKKEKISTTSNCWDLDCVLSFVDISCTPTPSSSVIGPVQPYMFEPPEPEFDSSEDQLR